MLAVERCARLDDSPAGGWEPSADADAGCVADSTSVHPSLPPSSARRHPTVVQPEQCTCIPAVFCLHVHASYMCPTSRVSLTVTMDCGMDGREGACARAMQLS